MKEHPVTGNYGPEDTAHILEKLLTAKEIKEIVRQCDKEERQQALHERRMGL